MLSDAITICNIDYSKVLAEHVASGKDVTAIVSTPRSGAPNYPTVFKTDDAGAVSSVMVSYAADNESLVGFGMFIIERELLIKVVEESVAAGFYHFEKDFLQKYFNEGKISVNLFKFDGVVLRNNTIEKYLWNNHTRW